MIKVENPIAPIAIWQFGGFFGEMRKIELSLCNGKRDADEFPPLRVRAGFEETLANLAEKHGFVHYAYIEHWYDVRNGVLRLSGLGKHFKEVASRDEWGKDRAWAHRYFTDKLGLTDDQARSRIVAIGNEDYSRAIDIPGVIFVNLNDRDCDFREGGFRKDTLPIEKVVTALLREGEGDFKRGFERVIASAKVTTPENYPFPSSDCSIDHVKVTMQYLPVSINDDHAVPETSNPMIYIWGDYQTARKPRIITEEIKSRRP